MSQQKRSRSERTWQRKRGRRLERTKHHSIYLGDELVVQGILSKLPVKSLLRFRCVSKSWSSLISTPQFISSQLRNCRTNNPQALVHKWGDGGPAAHRLLHVEDNRRQSLSLDFGFESPNVRLHVIGSAMGLICYYAVQRDGDLLSKFIIFNPETRSFLSVQPPLPSIRYRHTLKGFGFDDTTLDYKIFLAAPNRYVYIYSLNTNSWRFITCQFAWEFDSEYSATFAAIFAKDCFHWLIDEEDHWQGLPSILVFDIKSETFRCIRLQEQFSGECELSIIAGFGESSIGIVQELHRPRSTLTHVWLMDQNGSWFKAADDVRSVKRKEAKEVLGFRNKDELFIKDYSRGRVIVSQNIKTKVIRDVMSMEGRFHYTLHTHVPSLALLDKTIG